MLDFHGWDGYWDAFFAAEDVFYGHVLGFKGLERQVVVLALNGIRDQSRGREYLYVGLSRARSCLVVCGDLDQITSIGGESVRRRLEASIAVSAQPGLVDTVRHKGTLHERVLREAHDEGRVMRRVGRSK
jgi:hypothetical protein